MTSVGYAAILARLQAPQLRLHCDEALRVELMHVSHQLHDVTLAMQRLRDVRSAARTAFGSELVLSSSQAALLAETTRPQRDLGRAIAQFGASNVLLWPRNDASSSSFVCVKCQGREDAKSEELRIHVDEPLLAKPDTAALSPPRRKTPPPRKKGVKPEPRKKLMVRRRTPPPVVDDPRKHAKAETQEEKQEEQQAKGEPKELKHEDEEEEEEEDEEDDDDIVEILDDDPESDEEKGDVRTRLSRRIDECWPLATSLGALEMPQRRKADYTNLVTRVSKLFKTLQRCAVDDVASRSMRSVIVKARDSLAVAVSLLSLHNVTDASAPAILTLVRAVHAAAEKHTTVHKQIAVFRDSLAEFEVVLLTRSYAKPSSPSEQAEAPPAPRKKPRTAR